MASQTVVLKINTLVENGKNVTALTGDLKALQAAVDKVNTEKLRQFNAMEWSAFTIGLQNARSAVLEMQQAFQGLVNAYQQQMEAETKLEEVMRERMDATDAEVESIKALTAAQQELGIIGDEVQLAGAQQLATFLNNKEALASLIPAMNNLVAQQKGFNATSNDAVRIGNLMGKAMQGNVTALKRVGITFTDAQAEVMKYGSEQERAAMLTEIVTQNVGNMNQKLAESPTGKLKQMSNAWGDVLEKLGGLATGIMPIVNLSAGVLVAAAGVAKLAAGMKVLFSATTMAHAKNLMLRIGLLSTGRAAGSSAALFHTLATAERGAAAGAVALKVALRGLLISTGIGAAIAALTFVIDKLVSSTEDASDALKELEGQASKTEQELERQNEVHNRLATEAARIAATEAAQSDRLYKVFMDESKSREERTNAARRMVSLYPAYFSKQDAELLNVQKLSAGYRQLAQDIENAAKARALENLMAESQEKIYRGQMRQEKANAQMELEEKKLKEMVEKEEKEKPSPFAGKFIQNPHVLGGDPYLIPPSQFSIFQPSARQRGKVYKLKGDIAEGEREVEEGKADMIYYQSEYEKVKSVPDPTRGRGAGGGGGGATRARSGGGGGAQKPEPLKLVEDPQSLKDLRNNLRYWQQMREEGALIDIPKYDKEIQTVQDKIDKATGKTTETPLAEQMLIPADTLKSYDQLDAEMGKLDARIKGTQVPQLRAQYTKMKDDLSELRTSWEQADRAILAPKDFEKLKSLKSIQQAIQQYTELQQTASADEVASIQRTINALNRKADALHRGADLQAEMDEIANLTDKEVTVRIKSMGFEGLQSEIERLQKMMNDMENPITDTQRDQINSLIGTYQEWQHKALYSMDTVKSAWEGASSLASSITDVGNAFSQSGNLVDKFTTSINAAFAIYETVMGVIGIIKQFTQASVDGKKEEAAASVTSVAADAAVIAMAPAVASAEATKASAAKEAAGALTEEAVAAAWSAYAGMPFVGLALGGVTAAAIMASVKAAGKISAFAQGGIAYGPTLGLFGEYPGASNNPEVVAPLDKLKNLLEPAGPAFGEVDFRIRNDRLEGSLRRRERKNARR